MLFTIAIPGLLFKSVVLQPHKPLSTPKSTFYATLISRSVLSWIEGLLRAQLASPELPKDQTFRVMVRLATCLQGQFGLKSRIIDATEFELKQYEMYMGKDLIAAVRKYDETKIEAEAIKLFTEAGERFPKQEIFPGLTVGELAKSSLFEMQNLTCGKTAPEFEGEDLDGVKFKLSDYRGKVVMLSFWASWCGPCMGLVPHERELVEKYKDKPFVLLGVNSDEDKTKLKSVLETNKITWRSFWCGPKGPEGPLPKSWNVMGQRFTSSMKKV